MALWQLKSCGVVGGSSLQPVLIGGTGRSGSTIIGHLLDHHPDLTLTRPMEVRFITGNDGFVDALTKANTPTGQAAAELAVDRLLSRWFFRAENVGLHTSMDKEFVVDLSSNYLQVFPRDPQQATQDLVYSIMDKVATGCGAIRWVDTTPANARKADRVESVYPESKVVIVTRDGRDVAASFVHQDFGPNDVFAALDQWEQRMVKSHTATENSAPGRVLTFELVDLVRNRREATLKALREHIGVSESPEMLDWFNVNITAESSHTGRWRRDFDDRTVEAIDAHYSEICSRLASKGIPIPASGDES